MRNILFVIVDTLRPDHLGCYGYERPTSPNLDALAGRGTVLESLWSASNFTAPAFTSLFTGMVPLQHGVFDFTSRARGGGLRQALEQENAQTGAVVSFRFFRNLLADLWGEVIPVTDTRSFNYAKDLPLAVTDEALEWLDHRDAARPFGLFVHYDGPHMPYRLPDGFAHTFDSVDPSAVDPDFRALLFPQEKDELDGSSSDSMFRLLNEVAWGRRKLRPETLRWMLDKYDASVHYNDHAVGRLLDGLRERGLADDTVVVVLSDHGEEFHEHGNLGHAGVHLYEEVARTVGIVHDPRRPGPRRISTPLSQVDIWPTLLKLAGAGHVPDGWAERGMAPLLDESAAASETPVFCHGQFKVAMRRGRHKLIVARPRPGGGRLLRLRFWLKMLLQRKLGSEVYDLEADPGETRNLAGDKQLLRSLRADLDRHLAAGGAIETISADEEQRKRIEQEMKDLGYM